MLTSGRYTSPDFSEPLSRTLVAIAVIGFLVGIGTWPIARAVAISALVLATAVVLGAPSTWFRLDHLRELER